MSLEFTPQQMDEYCLERDMNRIKRGELVATVGCAISNVSPVSNRGRMRLAGMEYSRPIVYVPNTHTR